MHFAAPDDLSYAPETVGGVNFFMRPPTTETVAELVPGFLAKDYTTYGVDPMQAQALAQQSQHKSNFLMLAGGVGAAALLWWAFS